MKLTGTALFKKTAAIIALLMPTLGYAQGIDVSWSGPKQLTISAQPDGIGGFTTMCKSGTKVYFYAVLGTSSGMYQRMVVSTTGVPSGNCSEVLANVLPINVTLQGDEIYFFGLGKEINKRPADYPGLNVSLEHSTGTGNGWKPQPPPGPSCSLLGNSVDISYGDVESTPAQGLEKSSTLSIRCTSDATVKVSLRGFSTSTGIRLRADGSLAAELFVRDKAGSDGTTETLIANVWKEVPISSVLKVNGNLAGGAFSGSAIINVDIQ